MERHYLLGILLFCIAAFTCVDAQNNGCTDDPNYESTCLAIFFNTTTNITNSAACGNPVYSGLVPHCPNSCNLCSALGFGCNNTLPVNQCLSLAVNCNNTGFKPFMTDYCPQTCGFCGSGGGICSDLIANCSAVANLCNSPGTSTILAAQCPFTCGKCPTGSTSAAFGTTTPIIGCVNTATNCAANVAYCTNPTYLALMQQQCKQTCGYCSGIATTVSATCFDQNTLCPTYVQNGFCSNAGYTTAIKQATCQKSCGFCAGR